MSIASEIIRLQTAKASLKTAIEGKGVTVSSSATIDDYADYVDAISGGGSGIGDFTLYQTKTVSASDSSNITFTHDLGVVPKLLILTINTPSGLSTIVDNILLYGLYGCSLTGTNAMNQYFVHTDGTTGTDNSNAYFSSSSVIIRRATSGRYFDTNATYTVKIYA